jgi:hypothetical protein
VVGVVALVVWAAAEVEAEDVEDAGVEVEVAAQVGVVELEASLHSNSLAQALSPEEYLRTYRRGNMRNHRRRFAIGS